MAEVPRFAKIIGSIGVVSLAAVAAYAIFGDSHMFTSSASVIHVDLETPEVVADPEVIKLDSAYGDYQSAVNLEEDKAWALAIKSGNVDLVCLDEMLDTVDRLQGELHNEYVHFLDEYNSGHLTQQQIDDFNMKAAEKRAQIQLALQHAWDKTTGSNAYSCA